ncbi:hypothetical protein ABZ714_33990 [Streptomyces sp. NPDC006798]|uniref:hypothetical protein n=1 Tax=Streptomyces sp. NPDC006798 TaxID=3155462 RepID=UPI0034045820
MPSEGKPQAIDVAAITTPDDVPTSDLWLLVGRRDQHVSRITEASGDAADVLAALALGTAMRRSLDDQEQQLVREGLKQGATWEQVASAIGAAGPDEARAAFDRPQDGTE